MPSCPVRRSALTAWNMYSAGTSPIARRLHRARRQQHRRPRLAPHRRAVDQVGPRRLALEPEPIARVEPPRDLRVDPPQPGQPGDEQPACARLPRDVSRSAKSSIRPWSMVSPSGRRQPEREHRPRRIALLVVEVLDHRDPARRLPVIAPREQRRDQIGGIVGQRRRRARRGSRRAPSSPTPPSASRGRRPCPTARAARVSRASRSLPTNAWRSRHASVPPSSSGSV